VEIENCNSKVSQRGLRRGGNNISFNRTALSVTACSSSFTPLLLDIAFSGCGLKADFVYPGEWNSLDFLSAPLKQFQIYSEAREESDPNFLKAN